MTRLRSATTLCLALALSCALLHPAVADTAGADEPDPLSEATGGIRASTVARGEAAVLTKPDGGEYPKPEYPENVRKGPKGKVESAPCGCAEDYPGCSECADCKDILGSYLGAKEAKSYDTCKAYAYKCEEKCEDVEECKQICPDPILDRVCEPVCKEIAEKECKDPVCKEVAPKCEEKCIEDEVCQEVCGKPTKVCEPVCKDVHKKRCEPYADGCEIVAEHDCKKVAYEKCEDPCAEQEEEEEEEEPEAVPCHGPYCPPAEEEEHPPVYAPSTYGRRLLEAGRNLLTYGYATHTPSYPVHKKVKYVAPPAEDPCKPECEIAYKQDCPIKQKKVCKPDPEELCQQLVEEVCEDVCKEVPGKCEEVCKPTKKCDQVCGKPETVCSDPKCKEVPKKVCDERCKEVEKKAPCEQKCSVTTKCAEKCPDMETKYCYCLV